MKLKKYWTTTAFLILVFVNDSGSKDPFGMQPRLFIQDGHLIFESAANHNITFKTSGSASIRINDNDLLQVVRTVKTAVATLHLFSGSNVASLGQTIQQLQDEVATLSALRDQVTQLEQTVTGLNTRVNAITGTQQPGSQGGSGNFRRFNARLRRLETRVQRINSNLLRNECRSNPCLHGGTCVDKYNGYVCRCPSNWEGTRCDVDVNECLKFVGTELGCRNDATCINVEGGYSCQCTANWKGVHCTEQHDDCTGASQEELCGHGTCINVQRALPGQPKYTCICNQGWTSRPGIPACIFDIDECNSPNPPCSKNPPVVCINLPGTFICGACPAGYNGNGFACVDINECEINNGGCSIAPRVECSNNPGSRACGPCPAGYVGNGITCTFSGVCANNNGGCHPLATCYENTAISVSFRECRCPSGYIGNGVGPNGCASHTGSTCDSTSCVHGLCSRNAGGDFFCNCQSGYIGPRCDVAANNCLNSPCKNGGSCLSRNNGFTCTCTSDWQGPTCETAKQSCGGFIQDATGTLRYPSDPGQQYPHEMSCAWRITTTPGMVLNVTFKTFHLETSHDCSLDFLQIHDGWSAVDHPIGRYCGNFVPSNVISTHNQLYLWFRSDKSEAGDGFELEWNTTTPDCGGKLPVAEFGNINSPGYPGKYPVNRDCYWIVEVALGKRIQFHFATLMLESHPNCSYDFLQVRDGMREVDPILATHCTTVTPPPLQTSSSYAWLHFHSDQSQTGQGFHITYSAVPGIPGCGGLLTAERGALVSPNFPDPYQNVMDCEWLIRIHPEDRIQLTFSDFQIEIHSDCRFDFIEVLDGEDEFAPLLGRFCGNVAPRPITSSKNKMWIRFRADASVTGRGFRAQYITACGGVYTESQGIISSPYFPDSYPSTRTCNYEIQLPSSYLVHLHFMHFNIEGSDDCRFDYLEVRDGGLKNGTVLGHLCGNTIPNSITSNYNMMVLKFESDGSVQNVGFQANYTSLPIGCGGVMTEDRGSIGTPSAPSYYPGSLNCTWLIRAPAGSIIRLTFQSFVLEDHRNCSFDFVELRDEEDTVLGRFCGNRIPPVITSPGNELLVYFASDDSISREGFTASYDFLDASTVCGGNYIGQFGVIKSPQYPLNYPTNRDCTWVIHAANGQQIRLNVTDFDMERNRQCLYDYLEVRNGGYGTSPLVGKFCGTTIPREITSHGSQMFLHFHSDSSHTGHGFQIQYDGTSTGCGGILNSVSGSITSPNYPQPYHYNAECTWIIRVARSSQIYVSVVDVDIEAHSECRFDYLEVFDGESDQSKRLIHICNTRQNPGPLKSTGNSVRVKFRSDMTYNGRGFHLSYHAICEIVLTKPVGVIESPNFPEMYPHNYNCTWSIKMPVGNNISLAFSHLLLEGGPSCEHDYVEIKQGNVNEKEMTSLAKYCGTPVPLPSFKIIGNLATVHFVSDGSLAHDGFRLEYRVQGCGGEIKKQYGSISSPNYPNHYPVNIACQWHIISEPGMSIMLTIHQLDIERSSGVTCIYDNLKIYGGLDHSAPLLLKTCHISEQGQTVTSTGNHMLVEFQSDVTYTGKGFYIEFYSGRGCGGRFTADNSVITSPHYPNSFDANEDCTWQIEISGDHLVKLSFFDFNLPESENCTDGFLAVYDGSSLYSPLLLKHCGTSLPPEVTSSGNQLFLRLNGGIQTPTSGFNANYKSVCGAKINVERNGELVSPNYPHGSISYVNCSWILYASDPQERITLAFTNMMIFSYDNCTGHFLEIRDGTTSDAPLIGRHCGSRIPPSVTSQGNALHVYLYNFGVFRAIYGLSTSVCGGDFTSVEGVFHSPGFPNSYTISIECVWTIKSAPGNQVQMSISMFNLEESPYCNADYLEIREESGNGPLIGRFCGSTFPSNISISNGFWVKFRSDDQGTAPGFTAEFAIVRNVELSGISGTVASPGFPNFLQLLPEDTFTWTITVPVTYYVSITFSVFNIIYSPGYDCYSFVEFYDGPDSNSPLLRKVCGSTIPEPVVAHSNQIFIRFVSSSGHNKWMLNWMAVNDTFLPTVEPTGSTGITCGEQVFINRTASARITSPGFPEFYSNRLNCTWIIISDPERHVSLTFDIIDTEGNNESCHFDFISVYDMDPPRSNNWVKNKVICGVRSEPLTIPGVSSMRMVTFQTDSSYSRTGFSLNASEDCGGILTGERGILQSADAIRRYGNDPCEWLIQVRPGRTINITFLELNIPSGGTCFNTYLLLTNGAHKTSPYLGDGKYCGQRVLPVPESSSNQVYVSLQRVNTYMETQDTPVFQLQYEEVSLGCDNTMYLRPDSPSIDLTSPNYPGSPPHPVECSWIIMSPPGTVLRLDIDKLLFKEPRCWGDVPREGDNVVAVYDGGTSNSPILTVKCHENVATSIHSTGNVMLVRLVVSSDHTDALFKATVHIHTCGGKRELYDAVTSPNFPKNYNNNDDCEWTITERYYSGLLFFYFEVLELPTSSTGNCSDTDHVELRENTRTGPLIGAYCGPNITQGIQTQASTIVVIFKSDEAGTMKGFKLSSRRLYDRCGSFLRTASGSISTPNYPNSYSSRRYCYWSIEVAPNRRVSLTFTELNLPKDSVTGECLRAITVEYGFSYGQLTICSEELPYVIESPTNMMTIRIGFAGGVALGEGFQAVYNSDKEAYCGGSLDRQWGQISSPSVTTGNITAVACSYKMASEYSYRRNSTFIFQFTYANLGNSTYCQNASIYIRSAGISNERACGFDQVNQIWTYPLENLNIDYSVNDSYLFGFNATYQIQGCGGVIQAPAVISSPGFPSSYPENSWCHWIISAPYGSQIQVNFTEFQLEGTCETDYVLLRNGRRAVSPVMEKLCSGSTDKVFRSENNAISIIFHSDGIGSARGFNLTVSRAEKGCGGKYQSKRETISSPNYPNSYPNNIECEWFIKFEEGYHVNLTFDSRNDVEMHDNCDNDYLLIEQKIDNSWTQLAKLCGLQFPSFVASFSNEVHLMFHTNDQIGGDGFQVNYKKACGGNLTDDEGDVHSPGYPSMYDDYLDCQFLIHKSEGNYVFLQFSENLFSIENATDCVSDYVAVYQGNSISSPLLTKACGDDAPKQPYVTQGPMLVVFHTDMSVVKTGFSATYRISECGGQLNGVSGVFTSPLHPQEYASMIKCTWIITVPVGKTVSLKFLEFDLEAHSQCGWDYVNILNGGNESSPLIGQFCGQKMPPIVKSTGNQMTVTFATDDVVHHKGFKAAYRAVYGEDQGCGGVLRTESGTIASLDMDNDQKYEPNLDCAWRIITDINQVVKITFKSMDIEENELPINSSRCAFDFLEIRDGISGADPLIDRYCGQGLPDAVTSSSNKLHVHFHSDDNNNFAGFRLEYSSENKICGGLVLVTNETQTLASPSYPNNMPGLRCHWNFVLNGTSNSREKMSLVFSDFDVPCGKAYLEISNEKQEQMHRFCGSIIHEIRSVEGMKMYFASNSEVSGRGFSLSYNVANCSRNYTEENGVIYSPGYPSHFSPQTECTINIISRPGYTITLYFVEFELPGGYRSEGSCEGRKFEVFDGNSSSALRLVSLCGYSLPMPVFSSGPNLFLHYFGPLNNINGLFKIVYTTTDKGRGCGGTIVSAEGIFASPLYPQAYNVTDECRWKIIVPGLHTMALYFFEFSLSSTRGCETNYLEVFEGLDEELLDAKVARYCGDDIPGNYVSKGSMILVKLVTDGNNTLAGFRAGFRTNNIVEESTQGILVYTPPTVSSILELQP